MHPAVCLSDFSECNSHRVIACGRTNEAYCVRADCTADTFTFAIHLTYWITQLIQNDTCQEKEG